ncbi:transposase [Wolbachia endosymbiont of Brugia malayi]|uniref:transposase n=1 Tax=Wolbachia endosymbiont of Brugia malayi TaxID=80849 RepID=UPI0030B8448C
MRKTFLYQERDEEKRKEFIKKIVEINEENLVFTDESGIEDNEFYMYGWAAIGERLFAEKTGYKKRVCIIGALDEGKVEAPG